jgi:GNAT superfamily N-acetyltransferase
MRLVPAEGPLLEQILDFTYPIWNESLTRSAYGQWNAAQLKTSWGREHLHRFALVDDQGRLLATAKRYRHDARVEGRDGFVAGIGAVFTPPDLRGRGYASAIVERLVEQEQQAGAMAAALFSEIGSAFYERLGFVRVVLDEVTVTADLKGGAPAMLVRAGDERDLTNIVAMGQIRSEGARYTLRRDVPLLQYAITKKRLLAGLGPAGLRQVEFFVAEEGFSAVAYVVLTVSAKGWTLEEAGDRDPAGARLGAMLQVLAAREPSHRPPLTRTWWPRGFPVPPQLHLSDRTDMHDLLMIRPFVELSGPFSADDVFYWRSDYF